MGKSVSLTLRRHVVRLLFWTSLLLLVASPLDGVRVSRLVREKLKEQRQRRRPQWLQRGMIPLHLLCNIEAEWPMRAFLCLFLGPPFPATYVGFLFHEGRKMGRDLSFAFQPSFPTAAESERGREKEDYVLSCRRRMPRSCPATVRLSVIVCQ